MDDKIILRPYTYSPIWLNKVRRVEVAQAKCDFLNLHIKLTSNKTAKTELQPFFVKKRPYQAYQTILLFGECTSTTLHSKHIKCLGYPEESMLEIATVAI